MSAAGDAERAPTGADVPALEVDAATAGYDGRVAIEAVDLRVAAGELVGIVGPSGSGKTTLLRAMTGRVGLYRGAIRIFGVPVARGRPASRIGFVPQLGVRDPHFPLTVEQVVLQGLAPSLVGPPWVGDDARTAAGALIERLGLGEVRSRPIGQLSGGQLQRALLARAMIGRRRLIFLDEPTSGVDLASRRDILHLLGELNDDGLSIVLTTHDLNWVAAHLPRIVCLNRVVVADGPPRAVLTPQILRQTYGTETVVLEQGGRVLIADADDVLSSESAAGTRAT